MQVFVTGATGFIGKALIRSLVAEKHSVIAAVRKFSKELPSEIKQIEIGDLAVFAKTDENEIEPKLGPLLSSCDVFVHLAGRAHVSRDDSTYKQELFEAVNATATFKFAKLASKYNIKRFIFLSSIGVNGNQTSHSPFTERDSPNPQEPYAISKLHAEQLLIDQPYDNHMEWVIIRPPLVYGPGAPGNFANLIKWTRKRLPMPFGAVHNKRSMIALDNLTDFITLCLDAPAAGNQIFVIADDEVVSLTELLKKVANVQDLPVKLIPVPVSLMVLIAKMLGKASISIRLFSDLRVDNTKAHQLLGWKPVSTMDQQLKKMADLDAMSSNKP